MQLSSSSIVDGTIAKPHACGPKGGHDQPPALSLGDIPAEAKFLAIIGDDPDAVRPAGQVWVHWNVFNVPVTGSGMEIPAGQKLQGEVGVTSGQSRGYEGMCPPDGVHTYRFAVFAFRDEVQVDTDTPWTIDAFEQKFGGEVLAKARITGRF